MSYKSNTSIFLFCHFAIDEDSEDQKAQGMNDLCYSDIVHAHGRPYVVHHNIYYKANRMNK